MSFWGHSVHFSQNEMQLKMGLAIDCNGMKFESHGLIVVIRIWGAFDLLVFKVIMELFGALVSKCPVTRKRLAVEQT